MSVRGWGGLCVAGGCGWLARAGHGELACAPSGCAWLGSHACGCARPGWAAQSRAGSAPAGSQPSRCGLGPHRCRTSDPGKGTFLGGGAQTTGVCAQRMAVARPRGPGRTGRSSLGLQPPSSSPALQIPPFCSQPKISPGRLTRCVLHPAQLLRLSQTLSRTAAAAWRRARLRQGSRTAVPLHSP